MSLQRIDTSYPVEETSDIEPLVLKPSAALGVGFIILTIISVVWNGIVLVGFYQFLKNGHGGWGNVGIILFFTPFLLIGMGLVLGACYMGLALFNPKPVLVCSQRYLYANEDFELSWFFPKSVERIEALYIYLEGVEQASYRQGTTTRTETHTFYRQAVFESTDREKFARGEKLMRLPIDIMHSFHTANNKILWQVRFHGSIRWWPDLAETFTLEVLPPRLTS